MGHETPQTAPPRVTAVTIDVCGDVTVTGPGAAVTVRGRQPQTVVAFLALEGRPVRRDEVAHLLWGDRLGPHWSGALRGIVSKVRATLVAAGLPPTALQAVDGTIRLDPGLAVRHDVDVLHRGLLDAERALEAGEPGRAVEDCLRAADVLARPFLPHDESDWGRRRRESLDELAARAAHLHAAALLADGRPAAAAERARARVGDEPLDEAAHHLLIEALLADGRRTSAVEAFDELARLLHAELGLAPAPSTAALLPRPRSDPPGGTGRPPGDRRSDADRPRAGDPASFHPHDADPFVGRLDQQHTLEERWHQVVAERRPQVVVLEGPPGIGKTRLASHFCARVGREGGRVLWGRGRAEAGTAYGPLAEAIGAALDHDPDALDRLGARAGALVALLPHLRDRIGTYEPPEDTAVGRTHLFAATTATVAELARTPAVLVLDDLQWADDDALALLEAVLDGLEAPLLVVATTRSTPVTVDRALMSIQRLVPVTALALEGLSVAELAELLADPDLAGPVHARTHGLPFFVAEITRDARRSGHPIDPSHIPDAARDWVARRVATLPTEEGDLLALAAVVGPSMPLDLLERCAGGDREALVERVESLVAQGLLADGADPGMVEFAHVITRDVVHDALGATRRARLHRRVAEGIAAGDVAPHHHADLAHHFAEAGPGSRAAAAHHARLAGEEALGRSAWELAAARFARSVEGADEPAERTRALIGLGRAHHRLGHFAEARTHLEDALALARHHDLAVEQAEATLALVGRAGRGAATGEDDARQAAMLRAAADALRHHDPGDDDPARTRHRDVLACRLDRELALALLLTDAVEERSELLHRSLRRARSLRPPDPSATATALLGLRVAELGPDQVADRLADLDEVLSLPAGRLTPETLMAAHCYRHEDLLRLGDRAGAARALDEADALARHYRHPYWQWAVHTWRGVRASIEGDLETAERLAREACERQVGVAEATACLGVNLVNLRLFQGRAGEVLDLLGSAADRSPHIPCYRAVLALCAAEAGHEELARTSYRSFTDADFANLPEDTNRFLGLGVLAHVAVALGDRAGGRRLTELLSPYRGQWILLNCYGGGGAHWGPVAHQLARLAVLDGRDEDADALFSEAVEASTGVPLVEARIAEDRARVPALR